MWGLPQKQNARKADKIRLYGHLRRYKKIAKKIYIIYLEDYISDFLLNEFHDEELLQKKLHMLDEKIVKFQKENYSGDSYSAYYGMVNNIITRICLMEELSYSKQEIKEYRQKYRKIDLDMWGLPQKQNARRADKIRLCGHLRRYKKIVKKTYIISFN